MRKKYPVLRWALFIPVALIIGMLFSYISQRLSGIYLNQTFVNINGGLMFGVAYYFTGINIAPIKSNVSKWILLSILYLHSCTLVVCWYMDIPDSTLTQSIPMLVVAIGLSFLNPNDIED